MCGSHGTPGSWDSSVTPRNPWAGGSHRGTLQHLTRGGETARPAPKSPMGKGRRNHGPWGGGLPSWGLGAGSVASGGGIPTARLCPLPPAWDLGPDASQAGCLPPCWPGGPGWVAGLPGQAVAGGGGLGMHTQPLPLAACPGQAPRGGGASMALPAGAPLSPSRPLRPLPRRRQRQRPRLCLGSPPARNAPAGCLAAAPGMG